MALPETNETLEVGCGVCRRTFVVPLHEAVHVGSHPELRDEVLAERLHRFPCPGCAAPVTVEKMFAYTDFERGQWFVVISPVELPHVEQWREFAARAFHVSMSPHPALAERMTQRVVFGLASLREKLVASDAGIDDRLLELFKMQLLRETHVPPSEASCHLRQVAGDTLHFEIIEPGSRRRATARRTELEKLAQQADELVREWTAQFSGTVVDLRVLILSPDAKRAT
jgi:hypothetical protein